MLELLNEVVRLGFLFVVCRGDTVRIEMLEFLNEVVRLGFLFDV